MSKNKTDVNPKTVAKDDAKQKDQKIREGQEDSSVWGDADKPNENAYPRKHTADKQYDDEPEFNERDAEDNDER
jgi:hypothetical protein